MLATNSPVKYESSYKSKDIRNAKYPLNNSLMTEQASRRSVIKIMAEKKAHLK